MKKFLSLALALLMLIPLAAVGVGADSPADIYRSLYPGWGGTLPWWYGQDAIYDTCPTCQRTTLFTQGPDGGLYCSVCGRAHRANASLPDSWWNGGYDAGGTISPSEELNGIFPHTKDDCMLKNVRFYYVDSNRIYWSCSNCGGYGVVDLSTVNEGNLKLLKDYYNGASGYWGDHWWDHDVSAAWGYGYDYGIYVYNYRGGGYYLESRSYANYGDTKTITFRSEPGYVLYDVTVNGVSYGYVGSLTLTITCDTVIRAYYVPTATLKPCTVLASAEGGGTVTAAKNNVAVDSSKVTALYTDTLTYRFVPASKNYYVKNVTLDGKSLGDITMYTLSSGGLTKDHVLKATFAWRCPYTDVTDTYLSAVEYVTEAGIMGPYEGYLGTTRFGGAQAVTVGSMAAAFAEMTDVDGKLNSASDRLNWAISAGLIDKDSDYNTTVCDVQTACGMVQTFLTILEKNAKVNFTAFDASDTAEENAISIGLVSASTYKTNRDLNRYDLASICNLIAHLAY